MNILSNRKNLLWEGSRMFLPEHREALLIQQKKKEEYTPPELDENQKEWMNYILQEAIAKEEPILVTFISHSKPSPQQFYGLVSKIQSGNKTIELSNGNCKKRISLNDFLHVQS